MLPPHPGEPNTPTPNAQPGPEWGCGKKHLGCHCSLCRADLSAQTPDLQSTKEEGGGPPAELSGIDADRGSETPGSVTSGAAPNSAQQGAAPAQAPLDLRKECRDNSPDWWVGRWRDWHRGHGCTKDDGQIVSPDGVAEFAAAGRLPGRAAPTPEYVSGDPLYETPFTGTPAEMRAEITRLEGMYKTAIEDRWRAEQRGHVSGWLAGQKASIRRLSGNDYAQAMLAEMAPPSAPPVQGPHDEYPPSRCIAAETELDVISEVVTGERDPEEFMPATGVLGRVIKALREREDRMLLLKALLLGVAQWKPLGAFNGMGERGGTGWPPSTRRLS